MESKFRLLYCIEYQKTLYATQQLRDSTGASWASYITALHADHHVPWDEFRAAFHAHHLSAGLLRTKLKEFLDLEQGNRSVFDYTRQFNTLAQYGSYHINTDEKKANLYREWLTVHLQEHLGLSPNLSYNELVSAAIDQERLMKVVAEVDEKKRKIMMSASSASGGSSGAPPKYCMVYTLPGSAAPTATAAELGQLPTVPTTAILAATVAMAVATIQPCSYPTTTSGCSQATTAGSQPPLFVLQLWKVGTFHP
jgi:hypothetical protein